MLQPRPWTLAQAEWAVELHAGLPEGPVLELCCGAGQIGLAVVAATGRPLVQVDANEQACALARRNAEGNGIVADVRHGEMDGEAVLGPHERFPLVLADPPYVPSAATRRFPSDPATSIDGGPDGLAVAERCLTVAVAHLCRRGRLLLQTWGPAQAAQLGQRALAVGLDPMGVRAYAEDRALLMLRRSPADGED